MKYVATIAGREFLVEIVDESNVIVDGVTYHVDFDSPGSQPVYSMLVDGRSYEAYVYPSDEGWQVLLHGTLYLADLEDEREKRLRASAAGRVADRQEYHMKAPMPGLVVSIPVRDGETVVRGQVLLILESMKMQNELKSPRDGTVTRVKVKPGDSVEQRQTLLSVV